MYEAIRILGRLQGDIEQIINNMDGLDTETIKNLLLFALSDSEKACKIAIEKEMGAKSVVKTKVEKESVKSIC